MRHPDEPARATRWPGLATAWVVVAVGIVVALISVVGLAGLCQDGTHTSCLDGHGPDAELVGQLVAALFGLVVAIVALVVAARQAYRLAQLGLLIAVGSYIVCVALLESASG